MAAGYSTKDFNSLEGRELGIAFAEAMISFAKSIDFPTSLGQIDGFKTVHIERILSAAKNPQLRSKLENMPVPLSAELVDEYMGSIIEAAATGEYGYRKHSCGIRDALWGGAVGRLRRAVSESDDAVPCCAGQARVEGHGAGLRPPSGRRP